MKAISALITWIASRFTGWVAGTYSARFAAVASLVVVFTSIVATAFAAISGLVSGIEMVVNDDLSRAMSWFVPSNTVPCMVAGFSAVIIRATFDYHASIVRLWAAAL